jgi:hypothetical protein
VGDARSSQIGVDEQHARILRLRERARKIDRGRRLAVAASRGSSTAMSETLSRSELLDHVPSVPVCSASNEAGLTRLTMCASTPPGRPLPQGP